jgi:hypothetical protein
MLDPLLALAAVVAGGGAVASLRLVRDRPALRRLRLRIAVEHAPPGPRRELVRLRGQLMASAAIDPPRGSVPSTLLADARAVATQLDAHLAALLTDPDATHLSAALPAARRQVGEVVDALAEARLAAVATPLALLESSLAELRAGVERERRIAAATDAELRTPPGLLDDHTPRRP